MKNLMYLVAAVFAALNLSSCSNDDETLQTNNVPEVVRNVFEELYKTPSATWEYENGMLKAEFRHEGKEAEAWFKQDGTWVRTEFDYHSALPTAVQDHIATNYQDYVVDDIDWVETPDGNYFDIELDHKTKADVRLLINEDGTLFNG